MRRVMVALVVAMAMVGCEEVGPVGETVKQKEKAVPPPVGQIQTILPTPIPTPTPTLKPTPTPTPTLAPLDPTPAVAATAAPAIHPSVATGSY